MPAGDASPSVESAGRFGGPGTAAMADFVDMVAGAFVGEKGRVQKAVEDLSHGQAGKNIGQRFLQRTLCPSPYMELSVHRHWFSAGPG